MISSKNASVMSSLGLVGSVPIAGLQTPDFITASEPVLDHARRGVGALTDLLSVQMLELGPDGSIHVVVLSGKAILPFVVQRIEFVAPMTGIVEPFGRCTGSEVGRPQCFSLIVVCVCVRVQSGIPERTAVSYVVEYSPGEDIRMGARRRVHGVRTIRGIDNGPLSDLLHGVIAVSRPEVVLAEENSLGLTMLEANGGMLPITDVIAEADIEDDVAQIEAVEKEPKGIDNAMTLVDSDQNCRCIASTTSNSPGRVTVAC